LKPLPNELLVIIIKINLTTNYQLLLNCNKVHRACNPSASTRPHPPKIYPYLYCSLLNDGLDIEIKMNSLIEIINGWLVVLQRKNIKHM
jgi:hypothetical protein